MADSEPMADGERKPVAVSRRIGACAHDIFRVLIDPARHTKLDVGDGHPSAGTEDSGQEWGHRWSYEDGAVWIDAMSGTLERLDKMCTRRR